jgi:hypothetical protein
MNLMPMHAPHYITSLKMETIDHLNHSVGIHPSSQLGRPKYEN